VNFTGSAEPGELADVRIEHATSTTLRGTEKAAETGVRLAAGRSGRVRE
jgi:hypothetical protein